jgi:hypothetical protein
VTLHRDTWGAPIGSPSVTPKCHARSNETTKMRQASALRLKPGAIIVFGDHQYTAACTQAWKGEVLQVAPDGAVQVRVIDSKPWIGERRYLKERGNDIRWVPHYHIV